MTKKKHIESLIPDHFEFAQRPRDLDPSKWIDGIVSGQSNAVAGRGSEGGDQEVNGKVHYWNGEGYKIAELGTDPFVPARDGELPMNNISWQFAKRIQEYTGDSVYNVMSGKPGTPISAWEVGGEQWNNLKAEVEDALASPHMQNLGKTKFDFFFWFQGEADWDNPHYKWDLIQFRRDVVNEGWIKWTTPWFVGEPTGDGRAKQALNDMDASGDYSWLHLADNEGYERSPIRPAHFTAEGCRDYGRGTFFDEWNDAFL